MTSRYPTAADLAALRTLGMSAPSIMSDPKATGTARAWIVGGAWQMHPTTGAWPDELAHGIGFRFASGDPDVDDLAWCSSTPGDCAPERCDPDCGVIFHRREAAALRSRAFGMLPDTAATEAAIERYAPTR